MRSPRIILRIGIAFAWVYPIVKWLLHVVGDVDLVVSRFRDPAWIGGLLHWASGFVSSLLLSPTWISLVVFAVGVVLVIVDRRIESWRLPWRTPSSHLAPRFEQPSSPAEPQIKIELALGLENVGVCEPASMVKLTNVRSTHLEKVCMVKLENLRRVLEVDASSMVSKPVTDVPALLVLRTEGQCRDRRERSGPFTLRSGESKHVIVLWREPGGAIEPFFIQEDGSRYPIREGKYEATLAVYGPMPHVQAKLYLEIGPSRRVETRVG